MDQQDLAKAKELLSQAEHVGILLPERPDPDCLFAAEAVWRAAEASGKHVGLLPGPDATLAPVSASLAKLAHPATLAREFIIGIATDEVPVSQLRYEKHDDRIEIILSPKASPISEDSFSFREGSVQCDCLIAIGVTDIEAVPSREGVGPAFFADTPIIALANTASQQTYGDANLIASDQTPVSEIAYALVTQALGVAPDAETSTLLYAGIFHHTDGFRAPVRRECFAVLAELLGLGADQARAGALAAESRPFALTQLIGRAAVRSKETGEGNAVLWSFLTAEDFEKTGRTPADAIGVLASLGGIFPAHRVSVLLWQDLQQRRIHAALTGGRPVLDMIAGRAEAMFQSPSLMLAADFESFTAAEERVASLLREVL